VIGWLKMNAISDARIDDLLAVEIGAAKDRGESFKMTGQFPAPGVPVRDPCSEIGEMGEITNRWRANQQQLWRSIVRTGVAAQNEASQNGSTGGNLSRRDVENGLQIIAAKHHDNQIDGLMALEAGRKVVHPAAAGVEGVTVHGGAPVLALLNDPPPGAQC